MATIYLAGPMTGLPEFNYPAFNMWAAILRNCGHTVINPAESFDGDTSRPKPDYMKLNLAAIASQADHLAVLPGWEDSSGARIEVEVARECGVPVVGVEQFYHGCPVITPEPGTGVREFAGEVDGGGYKSSMDNPGKLRMSLIPSALYRAAARSLGHGAAKYADHNWRRGMRWSEVQSALLRHVTAWSEGEDNDPDSGLNHIDHIAACVAFLAEYVERPEYAKFDDRFKGIGGEANGR